MPEFDEIVVDSSGCISVCEFWGFKRVTRSGSAQVNLYPVYKFQKFEDVESSHGLSLSGAEIIG